MPRGCATVVVEPSASVTVVVPPLVSTRLGNTPSICCATKPSCVVVDSVVESQLKETGLSCSIFSRLEEASSVCMLVLSRKSEALQVELYRSEEHTSELQ